MGVHNKQRRAAKRRKRAQGSRATRSFRGFDGGDHAARIDERGVASVLVLQAVASVRADPAAAAERARSLLGQGAVAPPTLVADVAGSLLGETLSAAVRRGWTPSDLGHLARRRLPDGHLPVLAAALLGHERHHRPDRVCDEWSAERVALGPAQPVDATTADGLLQVLGLCALLGTLPDVAIVLPPPGSAVLPSASAAGGSSSKQLSRARALLAKAESTDFDEEAEALSAKAQELISRHALDQLIDQQGDATCGSRGLDVMARRLWLHPPYVMPKALLVDAVASANRCRTVISEGLGFSTVIGVASDLEWVELLSTSLLVQADRAMLRCGRHIDGRGLSRTRSFRRSFLVAYASRIAERLREATDEAAEQITGSGQLVPLLQRRERDVDQERQRLFPAVVSRETTISNGRGWAAGRAAADLALLDADLCPIARGD